MARYDVGLREGSVGHPGVHRGASAYTVGGCPQDVWWLRRPKANLRRAVRVLVGAAAFKAAEGAGREPGGIVTPALRYSSRFRTFSASRSMTRRRYSEI